MSNLSLIRPNECSMSRKIKGYKKRLFKIKLLNPFFLSLVFMFLTIGIFPYQALSMILNESQKIVASDGVSGDLFGSSVARDGNTVMVGATLRNLYTGAVYVYTKDQNSGLWQQKAILTASNSAPFSVFGQSIILEGNRAFIGAPISGAVYIFEKDSNDNWNEISIINASDHVIANNFGYSIAKYNNYLLVGAPNVDVDGITRAGAAYVFNIDSNSNYQQVAKLVADDPRPDAFFGFSVAMKNNWSIIGTVFDDQAGYRAGAVYTFKQKRSGVWKFNEKIIPNDVAGFGYFGNSVSVQGKNLVVGAPVNGVGGAVYVYKQYGSNFYFYKKITLTNPDSNGAFGSVVTLTKYRLSISDPTMGSITGSAYIYNTSNWKQVNVLQASDRTSDDEFGTSIMLIGRSAIVGSPKSDNLNIFDTGAAYLFDDVTP